MPERQSPGEEVWRILSGAGRVLLTTHLRPDGDGIASELALFMVLRSLGKEVIIVNQDPTPEIYQWLPHAGAITVYEPGTEETHPPPDVAVLLDCAARSRIGESYRVVAKAALVVCVDHHEMTECMGDVRYIDPRASSIGEMLYHLIPGLQRFLDEQVAVCLYTSLLTDTGSFSHANTTEQVFTMAAHLVRCGVNPELVHRKVYRDKRIAHFRLLSRALDGLKTAESGKIAYAMLPHSAYRETGAGEEDNEGILDVMKALRGGELFVLFRQVDAGQFKVSMRSTDHVNCSELARMFGGGGHARASGFSIRGRVEELGEGIMRRIISAVKEQAWI
jgi:phosphoesterase RecJ-like protein